MSRSMRKAYKNTNLRFVIFNTYFTYNDLIQITVCLTLLNDCFNCLQNWFLTKYFLRLLRLSAE